MLAVHFNPIWALVVIPLLLGFYPALAVRIMSCAWPRGHPRRAELRAELDGIPYLQRPIWVLDGHRPGCRYAGIAHFKVRRSAVLLLSASVLAFSSPDPKNNTTVSCAVTELRLGSSEMPAKAEEVSGTQPTKNQIAMAAWHRRNQSS
jgi:hypothetical protein